MESGPESVDTSYRVRGRLFAGVTIKKPAVILILSSALPKGMMIPAYPQPDGGAGCEPGPTTQVTNLRYREDLAVVNRWESQGELCAWGDSHRGARSGGR